MKRVFGSQSPFFFWKNISSSITIHSNKSDKVTQATKLSLLKKSIKLLLLLLISHSRTKQLAENIWKVLNNEIKICVQKQEYTKSITLHLQSMLILVISMLKIKTKLASLCDKCNG